MIDRLRTIHALLLLATLCSSATGTALGIPGTASTSSGYDTELGRDPICWKSREALAVDRVSATEQDVEFPNELVDNFRISGPVELLEACPPGISLNVTKPKLFQKRNFIPRTRRHYNYTIHAQLNLSALEGPELISDEGPGRIAIQILVCELGKAGFCSPFVHEQANAREAREGTGKKNRKEGDRHGGSHVHSKYVFVNATLHRSESDPNLISVSQEVPMIVNQPGHFFVIGAIQLFVTNKTAVRYDISNALHPNPLVTYQEQPKILTVREGVEWTVWVVIGIACWIILLLFVQTFRHRNHQVMQLSQGRFLLVFLAAAFWATASCFLLNPKKDIYCKMSGPMIIIPAQLVYAITIGRLWRIHRVISPLLLTHYHANNLGTTSSNRRMRTTGRCRGAMQSCWQSLKRIFTLSYCSGSRSSGKPRNIRRQVTAAQLAAVVALIMLPQIVIQILSLTVQPPKLELWYNEDKSVARPSCSFSDDGKDEFWESIAAYGLFTLVLVNVALLAVAKASQNLPSLFNETHVIFQSTLVNMIVLIIGLAVIQLTDSPTTSPEVEFLLWVAVVLSITLNSTIRIMWPKLELVWSNETILVSKLVSDHNEQQRKKHLKKKGKRESFTSKTLQNVTGFRASKNNNNNNNRTQPHSTESHSAAESAGGNRDSLEEDHLRWNSSVTSNFNASMAGGVPPGGMVPVIHGVGGGIRGLRQDGRKITVGLDQTPSRLLVLPMVRLQEQLRDMTSRITSGLAVTEESWSEFRELATNMAHQLEEEVQFEWELSGTRNRSRPTSAAQDDFPLILEKEDDEEAQQDHTDGTTKQSFSNGSNVEEFRPRQPDDGLPERGSEVDWDTGS